MGRARVPRLKRGERRHSPSPLGEKVPEGRMRGIAEASGRPNELRRKHQWPPPTQRGLARSMMAPAVVLLLIWMIVPLVMTLYFSTLRFSAFSPVTPVHRLGQLHLFRDRSGLLGIDRQHAAHGGRRPGHLHWRRHRGRPAARPGVPRPRRGAPPVHRPLLRDADRVGAGVWKNMFFNPVSGLFAFLFKALGLQPRRLPGRLSAGIRHLHRRLGVDALRHPHPPHLAPVAQRGAEGGRRDGRRERRQPLSSTSCCRTWPAPSPSSS